MRYLACNSSSKEKRSFLLYLIHEINSFMTGPVANQWTGFYMKTASVMKELKEERCSYLFNSLRYKYFVKCYEKFR